MVAQAQAKALAFMDKVKYFAEGHLKVRALHCNRRLRTPSAPQWLPSCPMYCTGRWVDAPSHGVTNH